MSGGTAVDSSVHRPVPVPDEVTAGFWSAVQRGELHVQYCDGCARYQHPPLVVCLGCGDAPTYRPVSGAATVYSFTEVHVPRQAAFEPLVPYLIVMAELVEQPGLLMIANMPGVAAGAVSVGMPIEFWAEELAPNHCVPQFRPAARAAVAGKDGRS